MTLFPTRRLKDYTFVCPCGGHFKYRCYDEATARRGVWKCVCCEQKPTKLVSVKLARR